MIARIALLIAGVFTLAGCGAENPPADNAEHAPSPILYEIADANGEPEGWLFGTIHSLPDGIEWRTQAIEQVIDGAQVLVVEIGDLSDTRAINAAFTQLATSPDQPDIRLRVAQEDRVALDEMLAKGNFSTGDFANIETWAAALMLAQVSSTGSPENGVDSALLKEFPNHRIRELEGTVTQLGIFDSLANEDQADLLTGVIDEYRELETEPDRLRKAWISGDEAALIDATRSGIMADPQLYEALLAGRNRSWIADIERYLNEGRRPLIAVGAAHLVGEDGLAQLLRRRGYTLTRLQ